MDKNFRYIKIIITVCIVHLLLGLDINIISVSLPSIAKHFQVNSGEVSRIMWVYFLVLTCFLIIFGKLGDVKGYRRIYSAGIIIFTAGSALCGASGNLNLLIVFRIIQATGGAVLFALTPAIISHFLPAEIQGKVFGINYAFVAIGGVIGRGLSGFLIQNFGWNYIFLINIPTGITALVFCYLYIPAIQKKSDTIYFDTGGSLLIFSSLFFLLYAINTGQEIGWTSTLILSFFSAALILMVVFIYRELKIQEPLFDLRILKNKNLSLSLLSFLIIYILTNGMIFLFPFYLQWGKGISTEQTGLLMILPSIMQIGAGIFSGYLSDKIRSSIVCAAGMLLTVLSYFIFLFLDETSGNGYIALSLIIFGIAIGTFIPSNTKSIMSYAKQTKKGSVSGLMITVIRAGSALGVCIFGTVLSGMIPQKNPLIENVSMDSIEKGFNVSFLFGFVIAIIGMVLFSFNLKEKDFRNRERQVSMNSDVTDG